MAWGYPLGGKKLELAAKMAQDASKSGFLRGLGGLLGAPWEAQEGAKLEQNRSLDAVFFKLKRRSYKKWSWNAFFFVWGAPWKSKSVHCIGGGTKISFSGSCMSTSS